MKIYSVPSTSGAPLRPRTPAELLAEKAISAVRTRPRIFAGLDPMGSLMPERGLRPVTTGRALLAADASSATPGSAAARNLKRMAAEFPYIRKEASAFAATKMKDVGLAGLDPDKTILVRFSRPSEHRLETTIEPSGMAIRQSVDIEQRSTLTNILTKGFPDGYDAHRMGAAKGEFGVYAKSDLDDKTREWATGTEAVIRARASYDPDFSFDGSTSASLVDSARLYEQVSTLSKDERRDFFKAYGNKVRTFWKSRMEEYALNQKNVAVQRATEAYSQDQLNDQDFDAAIAGLGGRRSDLYTVSPVAVGDYKSLDSLMIADKTSGRSLLYVPGSSAAWKGFANIDGARQWIREQTASPAAAEQFAERHFQPLDIVPDGNGNSVLTALLPAGTQAAGTASVLPADGASLVDNPFSELARWRVDADLRLARTALRKAGVSVSQLQLAQRAQWKNLTEPEAVANPSKTNAVASATKPAATATGSISRSDVSSAAYVAASSPTKNMSEDNFELLKQYPGLSDAATRYATSYLRKYGADIDPDATWMMRFNGPERPVLPFNNPDMAFYSTPLQQHIYTGDSVPPNHPWVLSPSQLTDKRSLTDVFLNNFDTRDNADSIANKKSIFGVYTEANLLKPKVTAATRAEFAKWSNTDSAKPDAKDVATSRFDTGRFYQDMQRAPGDGGNDFVNVYLGEMKTFWKNNTERYVRAQKENANAALDDAAKRGEISSADHLLVSRGFSGKGGNGIQVYPLAIGGHESINALRIVDADGGRTALYLPGEKRPFEVFGSTRYAKDWIDRKSKDRQWVSDFAKAHFSGSEATNAFRNGSVQEFLSETLQQPLPNYFNSSVYYPSPLSPAEKIKGDPFSHMATSHREKDIADVVNLNTSNVDRANLMKAMGLKMIPFVGNIASYWYGKGKDRDQATADIAGDAVGLIPSVLPFGTLSKMSGAAAVAKNTLAKPLLRNAAVGAGREIAGAAMQGEAERGAAVVVGSVAVRRKAEDSVARPAFDAAVSLRREAPNANGVYTIAGKQYISIDGNAARIQGLADANQRAILIDATGQPLSGVHVLRRPGSGEWGVGGLKGGSPVWGRTRQTTQATLPTTAMKAASNARPVATPGQLYGVSFTPLEHDSMLGNKVLARNPAIISSINAKAMQKELQLDQDATRFFASYSTPPDLDFPLPPTKANEKGILKYVYKKFDGMYIGETHDQIGAKKFLIDNMKAFKRLGVDTMYLEVSDDVIGQELAEFNKTGTISPQLHYYFENKLTKTPDPFYRMRVVAQTARQNGIELKPMDTYVAGHHTPGVNGTRIRNMNYYAYRAISGEQRLHPGKWVAWGGAGHSNISNAYGIPPLGELLGVPSMRIADAVDKKAKASFTLDPGKAVNGNTVANDWLLIKK